MGKKAFGGKLRNDFKVPRNNFNAKLQFFLALSLDFTIAAADSRSFRQHSDLHILKHCKNIAPMSECICKSGRLCLKMEREKERDTER